MKYSIWKIMRMDCEEGAFCFTNTTAFLYIWQRFVYIIMFADTTWGRLECKQCGVCHIQASLGKMQSVFGP